MLTIGAVTFAVPAALLGLAALPALWWLLRVTPPAPRRITFPPVRLLLTLIGREQQAVRTPLWLLAMRLLLASLLVLAAARPVYDAGQGLSGSGPLVLLIDNGWASAHHWRARQEALNTAITAAERDGREVLLVATAAVGGVGDDRASSAGVTPVIASAASAREAAAMLRPQPWATDRPAAAQRAEAAVRAPATVLWLSDGLGEPGGATADGALFDRLASMGTVRVMLPDASAATPLLRSEPGNGRGLTATAVRTSGEGALTVFLRLVADDGSALSRQPLDFTPGSVSARATIEMPAEWLQKLARMEIEEFDSAAAVVLVDRRWQRRAVGIATEPGAIGEQPLLGRTFYIERALEPYAELRSGTVAELLKRQLAVLVLADIGRLDADTAERVRAWVEQGGVLLRFAGPRLAEAAGGAADPLLPVALRRGDRVLGGALSWGTGGQLAAFEPSSPFAGLAVSPDIAVGRQVLAEPMLDEAARTWARLVDGTPLISGSKSGNGWLVLVHTTANADWSNLALSGLFVELLRRIADLGLPGGGDVDTPLPPIETLDGFGRLGAPPKSARTIAAGQFASTIAGADHPPGYYGRPDARTAVNLAPALADPRPLAPVPRGVTTAAYGRETGIDPLPWLLAAATALALIDLAVSLRMRGIIAQGRPRPRVTAGRRPSAAAWPRWRIPMLAVIAVLLCAPAHATGVIADGTAPPPAVATSLAYVMTGDSETDRLSLAALTGLGTVVNRRTAAELAPPVGVRPDRDDLSFYPLLYWPLVEPVRMPSPAAARRLAAYMRAGGTIVFDIRGGRSLAERADLRPFARALDLPPLVPVDADHVLRRSYYLLADLPGRYVGNPVWVEASGEHVNDGVSAVVAGANDWAGAWAVDEQLRPLYAVVPGGERQRELAYRFGVNLVMYVLTGNYKTDQVHLPAILERLRGTAK